MMSMRGKRVRAAKGIVMRRLLVAVGLIVSMSDAFAADPPILRGSAGYAPAANLVNWSGFYGGGHVGYGFSSMDFTGTTRDLVAHSLRELALESVAHPSTWEVLGKADPHGTAVGIFFGYNNCWENVILGFEFNYSRVSFSGTAPVSPIARVTSAGGNTYLVNITGAAAMHITDMATIRARAGVAIENFLPYMTIGVALGRANISRTATVSGTETVPVDPPIVTPFSFTESEAKHGAFLGGWSIGG